jgi:SAM-dependent methyltransferase
MSRAKDAAISETEIRRNSPGSLGKTLAQGGSARVEPRPVEAKDRPPSHNPNEKRRVQARIQKPLLRRWKGSGHAPEPFVVPGASGSPAQFALPRRIVGYFPRGGAAMNRKQWNRLAKKFETEACDISREESGDQVRRYLARARIPKKNGVLVDLGCGVGTFIREFGHRFGEVVGVEYAPGIIARAKQRCAGMDHVTWHNAGAAQAAARIGRRADLTVCMNVITSSNAATRTALWASLAAVTKTDGFALIVVPSIESDDMVEETANKGRKPRRTAARAKGLVRRSGAMQKHFAREELNDNLARAGFAVTRMGRAFYPWSIEGMRETPARRANRPWDWLCLARRL